MNEETGECSIINVDISFVDSSGLIEPLNKTNLICGISNGKVSNVLSFEDNSNGNNDIEEKKSDATNDAASGSTYLYIYGATYGPADVTGNIRSYVSSINYGGVGNLTVEASKAVNNGIDPLAGDLKTLVIVNTGSSPAPTTVQVIT